MLRALDLFCGAGGATAGILEAGFDEVVGIDTNPFCKGNYPGEFILGDACFPDVSIYNFDFVWASPPCQAFSSVTPKRYRKKHPNLIPFIRILLQHHPFTAIENVPQAPLRKDLILTGPMVGLNNIIRKRIFEVSFPLPQPPILHTSPGNEIFGITKKLANKTHFYRRKAQGLPGILSPSEACQYMGISHTMTAAQVGEAVPPAYARYIAKYAIEQIQRRQAC